LALVCKRGKLLWFSQEKERESIRRDEGYPRGREHIEGFQDVMGKS